MLLQAEYSIVYRVLMRMVNNEFEELLMTKTEGRILEQLTVSTRKSATRVHSHACTHTHLFIVYQFYNVSYYLN